MPGGGLKRHSLKTRVVTDEIKNMPYEALRRERVRFFPSIIFGKDSEIAHATYHDFRYFQALGVARSSWLSSLLDEYERINAVDPEHEDDLKSLCTGIYGGKRRASLLLRTKDSPY